MGSLKSVSEPWIVLAGRPLKIFFIEKKLLSIHIYANGVLKIVSFAFFSAVNFDVKVLRPDHLSACCLIQQFKS